MQGDDNGSPGRPREMLQGSVSVHRSVTWLFLEKATARGQSKIGRPFPETPKPLNQGIDLKL